MRARERAIPIHPPSIASYHPSSRRRESDSWSDGNADAPAISTSLRLPRWGDVAGSRDPTTENETRSVSSGVGTAKERFHLLRRSATSPPKEEACGDRNETPSSRQDAFDVEGKRRPSTSPTYVLQARLFHASIHGLWKELRLLLLPLAKGCNRKTLHRRNLSVLHGETGSYRDLSRVGSWTRANERILPEGTRRTRRRRLASRARNPSRNVRRRVPERNRWLLSFATRWKD